MILSQEEMKTEKKIKELKEELVEWEEYNKIENDILRTEIQLLEKYLKKIKLRILEY